jgi:hypothetical protein
MDLLTHLDDGGLWLGAVVTGLVAVGYLLKKARNGYKRAKPWLKRVGAVLELAEYELQHNGGGSIKDSVSKIPGIERDVAALKEGDAVLREGAGIIAERAADMRQALAEHVDQAAAIHDEQAAAIAHLAEALPIVARSTPHPDDALDDAVGP